MDVLIMLGTTSAWLYAMLLLGSGYYQALMKNPHLYQVSVEMHVHYFEMSSVLITIVLLGRYIESFSKKKTVDQLA
jgi:Cu+-exporting ATPase